MRSILFLSTCFRSGRAMSRRMSRAGWDCRSRSASIWPRARGRFRGFGRTRTSGPKDTGELKDWRVIESVDEPSAITTLEPVGDIDVIAVRARLIEEHAIVTTGAEMVRAPFEMTKPVLRVSPHVDGTDEELELLAGVLASARRV